MKHRNNMVLTLNGQPQPIQPMVQSAMFYPNTYINFNQGGDYTKHYYNGTERICSRLGEQQIPISVDNDQELEAYQHDVKQILYNSIGQHLYEDPTDMQEGDLIPLEFLQATGDNNAIFYYHPNHLASTMYVTDAQQSVVQSFLYAPYGDIISEYNPGFNSNVLPNYAFNAKELDEETGFYYYEARYYNPPTFISRDPLMSEKPWLTPYHYCSNNPVGRVDPSGMMDEKYYDQEGNYLGQIGENTDVRVLNSTMSKEDAMTLIASGSEESAATLMDNSVAFADYFTNVSDVTNGAAVVPYSITSTNGCYDAATQQMNNAGYGVYGSWNESTIFTAVSNATGANPNKLSSNTIGGAIRMMTDLKNGIPVMAGVFEYNAKGSGSLNTKNRNPATGHFIVFNGVTVSKGNVDFNYMDNATKGRGSLNLDMNTGVISGSVSGRRGDISNYRVSEVRKSYKIKK